jgi:Putative Flp pilus-assembly TadE/G-like
MTTIAPYGDPYTGPSKLRISAAAWNMVVATIERSIKGFWGDTHGIILPYVTVMLVVIVGVSVLALDGSRYLSLQTQLQNGADALALAGAAELDRTPTAIERANKAIGFRCEANSSTCQPIAGGHGLVSNWSLFGSGPDRNVRVAGIRFLRSLPVHDSDPILPGNVTSDPTQAAFVEVTVKPIGLPTILPASIFGGSNLLSVGALAVAGFDQVVCDFTPVFICNPFETPGMTYQQATTALINASHDPAAQRRLIRLAGTQENSGAFGRGDVGYLAPTTGSLPTNFCGPITGGGIGQAMAASRPPTCLRLSGVDLQPGNDQAAMDGLNTRFDIYASAFESCKDNYVADVNVRKGYVTLGNANWCDAKPSGSNWPVADAYAAALPVDKNMLTANQNEEDDETDETPGQVRVLNTAVPIGNGIWDCAGYWRVAHSAGPGRDLAPPGCTEAATISRYSVYQYEFDYISDRSPALEIGAPQCNPLGIKYRRILNAAIINCGSSPVSVRRNARDIPVAGFGKFFLTLPGTARTSPYAEFLGLIKPTDSVNHDMVQLYR